MRTFYNIVVTTYTYNLSLSPIYRTSFDDQLSMRGDMREEYERVKEEGRGTMAIDYHF